MASIVGTRGKDDLVGTGELDRIQGLAGNDRLFGLGSNDLLYGGVGVDTARYQGTFGQYEIAAGLNGIVTINVSVPARDGTDGLFGINRLQFTDVWADLGNDWSARQTAVTGVAGEIRPAVAGLATGGWVTVFQGPLRGPDTSVYASVFDALGQPVSGTVSLGGPGTNLSPAVASLANGGFVASWQFLNADTGGFDIVGRTYDASANVLGDIVLLNSITPRDQTNVALAATQAGGFVATWSGVQPGGESDIFVRLIDANGNASRGEQVVNVSTQFDQSNPSVAALANGTFAVAYETELPRSDTQTPGRKIGVRVVDSSGTPVGEEIFASGFSDRGPSLPSVAALASGGFVVTWHASALWNTAFTDAYARIFDANGQPLGDTFRVNTGTGEDRFDTTVAASPQGGFLVTWKSLAGFVGGIYGRLYDTAGNPLGDDFRVSTTTRFDRNPGGIGVGALADGGYATVWGMGWADPMLAQRIDADGGLFGNPKLTVYKGLDYIASHGDLINAFGLNVAAGVDHYVNSGAFEGRSVTFNGLEYIASYGDLIGVFGPDVDAGTAHYIASGFREGRVPSFNGLEYIASHSDLISAFGPDADAGAAHFITAGAAEGRRVSFNGLEYIASYRELISWYGADPDAGARHYIGAGLIEGRTTTFDGLRYIASYGDLIERFGANGDAGATHFIENGVNENRTITFDPLAYLAKYADLQAAFGSDTEAATIHFITNGFDEGRTA